MKQIFNRAQQSIWSNEDKWHQTLLGGTSPPSLIYLTNLVHWARLQAGTPRLFLAAKFCKICNMHKLVSDKVSAVGLQPKWRGRHPGSGAAVPSPPPSSPPHQTEILQPLQKSLWLASSETIAALFTTKSSQSVEMAGCSFLHSIIFSLLRMMASYCLTSWPFKYSMNRHSPCFQSVTVCSS